MSSEPKYKTKEFKTAATRRWRHNHPGKQNEHSKQWRIRNRAKHLLSTAKQRAKKKGIEFDLTVDDIVVPTHCPILGLLLDQSDGKRADDISTIDRLDPSIGYVRGNVFVISDRANRIKNNGTFEEHLKIAEWMKKQYELRNGS